MPMRAYFTIWWFALSRSHTFCRKLREQAILQGDPRVLHGAADRKGRCDVLCGRLRSRADGTLLGKVHAHVRACDCASCERLMYEYVRVILPRVNG